MSFITENIPSSFCAESSMDKDDEKQQDIACNNINVFTQSSNTFDNYHHHQNNITTDESLTSAHKTRYENSLDDNITPEHSHVNSPQLEISGQHGPSMDTSVSFAAAHDNNTVDQDSDDSSSVYSNESDYVDNASFHLDQTTRQSPHRQVDQIAHGSDVGSSTPIDHRTNVSSISLSSSDDTSSSLGEDSADRLFEGGTHIDPGVLNCSDSANTGASTPPLDDLDDQLYFGDRKPIDHVTTIHDDLEDHARTTPTPTTNSADDDDYNAVDLNNMDRSPFPEPDDQIARYDHSTTNKNKTALRLSTVSVSDLNDISLLEDVNANNSHDTTHTPLPSATMNRTTTTRASISSQSSSILKTAMSNITNAVISKSVKSPTSSSSSSAQLPPVLPPKDRSVKPTPIDTAGAMATSTIASPSVSSAASSTQRFVSGLWSPFKSTPTITKKVPQQEKPQAPPTLDHCDLPGFQEALLAQMEQLNSDNGNDPKAQQLMNLKRQTIRQSLVLASSNIPNKDHYDWDFWSAFICDFDQMHKSKDLSRQMQKGVPPSLRGMVWQLLANVKTLDEPYMDLLQTSSPYDKMIKRDLARTFPGHDYFKEQDGEGQEGLYNVVRAYSVFDTEVGYCQGLAFIVGPLLLNMPDEEAFCVLIGLMSNYGLRGHFTPNMEGLHLRIYQFESLVAEHLPHISRHLQRRGIDSTMFASQWFMTLFAYKFPLDLVFRIYDMIFAEGLEVILKFALALLKRNETHLLQLDFEHLLDFLKNGLFEEYKNDEGQLVLDASAWNIPRKQFGQLAKEHKARVVKEEQNAKLVDTLQKQQVTLRQQVDQLQHAKATLEKEHQDVKDQLRDSQHQRQHMLDEQDGLRTAVASLQADMQHIPMTIEATFKDQFDPLCTENALLNQTNARLEDQLSSMETLLIDIKMKYAQSENERDELSKRLFEMKKVIAQ